MEFKGTPEQWNKYYLDQPTHVGLFLQSWEWGEFVSSYRGRVHRFDIDGVPVQVCEKKLPLGLRYWYAPRVLLDAGRFEKLKSLAEQAGVVFVRIEPVEEGIVGMKSRSVQPHQTHVVQLVDDDEVLGRMHSKTRYNIRLAGRKGVEVEFLKKHADDFVRLVRETSARNQFGIHPMNYYHHQISQPNAHLVVGKHEGKVICAHVYWVYGDTITYLHGASSDQHRNVMAPYAVHWAVMQWARDAGVKWFDLWGIDEKKWPALTGFKRRFGGEDISYPGCFDVGVRSRVFDAYRASRWLMHSVRV